MAISRAPEPEPPSALRDERVDWGPGEAEAWSRRIPAARRGRFVGRARELSALADLLAAGERLVTLVGPPGVGKTRLAIEAADAAERTTGLRPLWAALSAHRSLEDAIATIAGLLGVRAASGDPAASVGDFLAAHGPLLLVLDDVDGLGDALAPLLGAWSARARGLVVLVTSRSRLGLEAERVVEVRPLAVEDAVALFEQRARAARREARAAAATPEIARSLVERLDCLPLAIELAAARTGVLTAPKLLARLDRHPGEILRGAAEPRRAERGRHASLAAAIEVSWQLLGDPERKTLARCAAFVSSFSLEGAEAVAGGDDVEAALASLHERSLLQRVEIDALPSEIRFELYASVRAFALARLDESAERDAVESRVDSFVAAEGERLVRALAGPDALDAEQRLELEREQLVATHRREGRAPAIAARVGLVLAELSALRGVASTAIHEATVRAARASGDDALVVRSLVAFGVAAARLGFADDAGRALDEAVSLAERARRELLAEALFARGRYGAQHGHFARADEDLARAESRVAPESEAYLGACVKNVQGCVAELRGDFAAAVRAFESARAGFRRAGSERMEAAILNNLGVVRQAEGRLEDSLALYESALARAIASGNRAIEADTRMNLGSWHLGQGELDRAEDHSRLALALQRRLGNRRFEGVSLVNLAMIAHERGELRAARDLYQEALATLRGCGEARFATMALPFAAAAEAQLGLVLEARADFDAARAGPAGVDPGSALVVETLASFLLLAEARGDDARREEAEREALARLARARAALEHEAPGRRQPELGQAARLLAKALGHGPKTRWPSRASDAPAPRGDRVLVVGGAQRWFSLGDERAVDLSRRGPLRLILRALMERRADTPGLGVAPEALFAAGWPGQRALPHAAANRVYSAIATLRRLGLDAVLKRQDDGYLLDPALAIERRDEHDAPAR